MTQDMQAPRCFERQCKHFRGVTEIVDAKGVGGGELAQVPWCSAFPSGIPDRIAFGDDPHVERAADQFGDAIFEEGPAPEED